jgi:S1-C subfamily serine protease
MHFDPPSPAMPADPLFPSLELPATEVIPPASITATPPDPPSPQSPAPASADHFVAHGLWHWVLPGMFFLSMALLALYATPYLLMHWRMLDAQGEAEATFLKRRAELRAEAQHADERLVELDKRVQLTSLGFREVVRKVAPHVVNVACFKKLPKGDGIIKAHILYDPDTDTRYLESGVGSGIVVRPGVILTNHHVVFEAERLRVTFASGQTINVGSTAIAADDITDLAIIRLPADLPAGLKAEADATALFADSDRDVEVGDWALAIGSPLGLRQTVTQGVISAKGRLLEPNFELVELLQTDAAINPGNSGGPLFDQHGRVVGINVAIAGNAQGQGQGIGFAIPSNTVKKISDQLLARGEVLRGYLGVLPDEVPGPLVRSLKIDGGAIVFKQVVPEHPASAAGLQVGDIVVKINKETLSRQQPIRHFRQIMADLEPGAQAELEIIRDREHRVVEVTIGRRPVLPQKKAPPR